MNRKTIALVLILALCLCLFAGCKQRQAEADLTVPVDIDPAVTFSKYDVDDVVMTVDGSEVTWAEFFYRLYSVVYQLQYYSEDGTITWADPCVADSTVPNGEYVWETAKNLCVQYHTLETRLTDMGVTLTEKDEDALNEQLWSDIESLCGADATEDDFNRKLDELFFTRDTYDFIKRVSALYNRVYEDTWDKGGADLSDGEIAQYAEDNEYITAKHILIKTLDDNDQPLTGNALAEKTARATLLLARLQAVEEDRDALLELFDELMHEYSEDTGLATNPDGYTFTPGTMVEEFQSGAEALGDYEISDLVESRFGYHIILRLPVTRSSVVQYVDGENDVTMGVAAGIERFGKQVKEWMDAARVVWSKDFKNESADSVFALPADYVKPTTTPEAE